MSATEEDLRKAQERLARRQAAWEVPKALAALTAAAAVFMGFVIAGITWLTPKPQQITVQFGQPLQVQMLPAPEKH